MDIRLAVRPGNRRGLGAARTLALVVFFMSPTAAFSLDAKALPPGAAYEVGFSPGGTALSVVLDSIRQSRKSVLMACYGFTSRRIARALIEAERRGVRVAVVADYEASRERYSLLSLLSRNGIAVRRDARYAIEHNKFIVVDGEAVELGSFNMSESAATRNAEDALLLDNVPGLAASYAAEWRRLWNESR